MERIGERLRRRREELGFTIADIAKATKYRADVIKAVEEGRTGVFPAVAYRQAFLRAYADKLGLNPSEIVRDQKSEEERVQEALKGIRVKPRKMPGLRRTAIWLLVIVAVAVGLLFLYDRVLKERYWGGPADEAGTPRERPAGSGGPAAADSGAVGEPEDSAGMDTGAGEDDGPGVESGIPDGDSEETGAGGMSEAGSMGDRAEAEMGTVGATLSAAPAGSEPGLRSVAEERGEGSNTPTGERDRTGEEADEVDAPGEPHDGGRELAPQSISKPPSSKLAVSVRGYAVRARLRAGDSVLVDRWLPSGFRGTYYSNQPFWADTIITNEEGMDLVLNGEKVDLPKPRDNVITDFRISP
jgi:cytoskeleton protein RodZ